jgi:hypothetical protein
MSVRRPRLRGFHYLYDPVQKRLHIHGSHSLSDLDSIASMIRQRVIASDLDAVIYRDVDCIRIIRGRVLGLLVEIDPFWPGIRSE